MKLKELLEAELDSSTLEEFLGSYYEAALWSSVDDNDEPMDSNYSISDISPESQEKAQKDSLAFLNQNMDTLDSISDNYSIEQAGHDFWLTRVGHGAGFWDRGLGEAGDTLTASSKEFGNVDIVVGDDGQLYFE